jgi:hypothetical protein
VAVPALDERTDDALPEAHVLALLDGDEDEVDIGVGEGQKRREGTIDEEYIGGVERLHEAAETLEEGNATEGLRLSEGDVARELVDLECEELIFEVGGRGERG